MQAAAPEGENRDEAFVRGAVGRLDVGIGYIYHWEASPDYNPSAGLERIEATLLAINAADDERNPPETGVTEAAMKRVENGKLDLMPASTETRGHLTTGDAKFYKQQLQELLQTAPQRTM